MLRSACFGSAYWGAHMTFGSLLVVLALTETILTILLTTSVIQNHHIKSFQVAIVDPICIRFIVAIALVGGSIVVISDIWFFVMWSSIRYGKGRDGDIEIALRDCQRRQYQENEHIHTQQLADQRLRINDKIARDKTKQADNIRDALEDCKRTKIETGRRSETIVRPRKGCANSSGSSSSPERVIEAVPNLQVVTVADRKSMKTPANRIIVGALLSREMIGPVPSRHLSGPLSSIPVVAGPTRAAREVTTTLKRSRMISLPDRTVEDLAILRHMLTILVSTKEWTSIRVMIEAGQATTDTTHMKGLSRSKCPHTPRPRFPAEPVRGLRRLIGLLVGGEVCCDFRIQQPGRGEGENARGGRGFSAYDHFLPPASTRIRQADVYT